MWHLLGREPDLDSCQPLRIRNRPHFGRGKPTYALCPRRERRSPARVPAVRCRSPAWQSRFPPPRLPVWKRFGNGRGQLQAIAFTRARVPTDPCRCWPDRVHYVHETSSQRARQGPPTARISSPRRSLRIPLTSGCSNQYSSEVTSKTRTSGRPVRGFVSTTGRGRRRCLARRALFAPSSMGRTSSCSFIGGASRSCRLSFYRKPAPTMSRGAAARGGRAPTGNEG